MARCPICKEEIDYVNMYEKVEQHYKMWVDRKGNVDYDLRDSYPLDDYKIDYECPECEAVLSNDEGEIINLFNDTRRVDK